MTNACRFRFTPDCRPAVAFLLCLLLTLPAQALSPQEESDLGRRFALEVRVRVPLLDDPDVTGFVRRLGQRIVAELGEQPFTYRFAIVRDPNVNAFAVPGGFVYLHGGLLLRAANEDEVAGVLGHEIAHVHAHHMARQQEATQALGYAAMLGVLLSVIQPALGAGAIAAQAAAQLQYQRDFEQEADFLGARFMRAAGFAPAGMLDFFKKLDEQQRHSAAADVPPYLQSHPLSSDRLTNLEAVLRQRQWEGPARPEKSLALERVQLLTALRSVPPELAVASARQRAESLPHDGRARYLHGLALLEVGRVDDAATELDVAMGLGVVEATRDLGRTRFRQRRAEAAEPLLARAVATAPDDTLAWLAWAEVLQALGRGSEAESAYRKAVELDPDCEVAHYGLGQLAGKAGRTGEGFYHLGVAHYLDGEIDTAMTQFRRASELLPQGESIRVEVQRYVDELEPLASGK